MKPYRNKMSSVTPDSKSKIIAVCFLLIGGLFLVACQPKVENTNVMYPAVDYTGYYKLVAVDGAKVPGTVLHDGMEMLIRSGSFEIRADGTCISKTIFSPQSGYEVSRVANASYIRNGSELKMQWEGAGNTTGTIQGDTFTMDNHGLVFVYKK